MTTLPRRFGLDWFCHNTSATLLHLQAVTGPLVNRESGLTQPMPEEDMDALLSPKTAPSDDVLSTSPTAGGDLEVSWTGCG